MRRGYGLRLTILLLLLASVSSLKAQQQEKRAVDASDTSIVQAATSVSVHSPTKAILLSLLPGAGQVYNHQAWKIPIVYGIIGGLGYFAVDNYHKMVTFREEYLHRVNGGEAQLEGYTTYPDASIYSLYQSYNQRFQLFTMLTLVAYGLNLIDAYVFGHLFDFQINDDLTLHVNPEVTPQWLPLTGPAMTPSLSMTLRF